MHSPNPLFPAIRKIAGEWVLVHPRVLTSEITHTEPHIVAWLDELLHPRDTFFDVGANCGWLALRAARRVGPSGRVVAFEPAPVLAEMLAYHKRVNRSAQLTHHRRRRALRGLRGKTSG